MIVRRQATQVWSMHWTSERVLLRCTRYLRPGLCCGRLQRARAITLRLEGSHLANALEAATPCLLACHHPVWKQPGLPAIQRLTLPCRASAHTALRDNLGQDAACLVNNTCNPKPSTLDPCLVNITCGVPRRAYLLVLYPHLAILLCHHVARPQQIRLSFFHLPSIHECLHARQHPSIHSFSHSHSLTYTHAST